MSEHWLDDKSGRAATLRSSARLSGNNLDKARTIKLPAPGEANHPAEDARASTGPDRGEPHKLVETAYVLIHVNASTGGVGLMHPLGSYAANGSWSLGVHNLMGAFLYRCPNTGHHIQGWVADDPTERADDTYEALTCLACTRVHLIDPKTGRVLGVTNEE